MTTSDTRHRIIFIDLMRAFAVLQMVQGHTVNVLLANEFRNPELPVFAVWHFMRGMTAPIFMFTAGTVFTYLFRLVQKPFFQNPRVKKGIKRGLLLITLGYILRFPTWNIFDYSGVDAHALKIFFAVDVLQLIGFSLLALLFLLFLTEKFKIHDYFSFAMASVIIFFSAPFLSGIDWTNFLPTPVAAYFYEGTGSLFPFFPWAGYVIAGGLLGSYLAQNPLVFKSAKFSLLLAIFGSGLLLLSLVSELIQSMLGAQMDASSINPVTIIFRVGFVLMLNSLVSYISLKVENIPSLLILVGRNTLLIYVVHLIILYGSAWNPGLSLLWGSSFDGWQTFVAALIMITVMTFMVIFIHKLRIKDKGLV